MNNKKRGKIMTLVKWQANEEVAVITINNAPANALSSEVLKELNAILTELEHHNTVRVIVLHGEGRFFSAGADIKEFAAVKNGEVFSELATAAQQIFERIETYNKPVIAAVHGAALGGGLELMMSCHLRYVTKEAVLGLPELQLGLLPGFAGTQRLPRYVGLTKATEMILTSEPIHGDEAVQYGLANAVFADDKLLDETLAIAKKIALKSPLATERVIEALQYVKTANFYEGMAAEAKSFGALFDSQDGKEGIAAFIEKRQPKFTGK